MIDETTPRPPVEIVIGKTAKETQVVINGQDITRSLQGVRVDSIAGRLTRATLFVVPGHARVTVDAALEDVQLADPRPEPPAEPTP